MKNNQPVTQVEVPFLGDKPLVSKTDLRGIITYASDSFVAQSGFSRDELIGTNHNIIRHPDMPPEAFRQMWDAIRAGTPWRGIVKNRTKNGDHYWVDAFVVPIYQSEQIVGYMSARTRPSREQIAAAEALYRDMAAGKTRSPARRFGWPASLRGRLAALVFCSAAITGGVGALALWALAKSNQDLEETYHARLEPARTIGRILLLMSDNRTQAMLALEHRPGRGLAPNEHGPLEEHLLALERNRDEISGMLAMATEFPLSPEERRLMGTFADARDRYVSEGLNPILEAIRENDFGRAEQTLLSSVHPLYLEANRKAETLLNQILQTARNENDEAAVRYRQFRQAALAAVILGVVLSVLIGLAIARQLMQRIRTVRNIFERMAQGELRNEIDLSGRDEMGGLMASLASMQVQLRVMLDEISLASETMEKRVKALHDRIYDVAEHSEEQQDALNEAVSASSERADVVNRLAAQMEEAAASIAALVEHLGQSKHAQAEASASIERALSVLASDGGEPEPSDLQVALAATCSLQSHFTLLLPLAESADQATTSLASELRLHVFANDEVIDQMKRISTLISDNRQAVHDTWQFAQDLKRTSEELKSLVSRFR